MVAVQLRKQVRFLKHFQDADGDIVFYFVDPADPAQGVRLSSPIVGIRRLLSAVLDLHARETARPYVITTRNTAHQVRLSFAQAQAISQLLATVPTRE